MWSPYDFDISLYLTCYSKVLKSITRYALMITTAGCLNVIILEVHLTRIDD